MIIEHAIKSATLDRLDSELLLAHVLKKDRAWLLAHGETHLSTKDERRYAALAERRKRHEPVAYITGEKEFYGRTFHVDPRVLIPRPSTEALIDEVKYLFAHDFAVPTPRITDADTGIVIVTCMKARSHVPTQTQTQTLIPIDIGTGSGCIAITLALEIPDIPIITTDISNNALAVAKENARRHNVTDRITFIQSDITHPNLDNFDNPPSSARGGLRRAGLDSLDNLRPFLLISNPPYLPSHTPLPPDVSLYEPRGALFAGDDGMRYLTKLMNQYEKSPLCMGVVMECLQEQAKKVTTTL